MTITDKASPSAPLFLSDFITIESCKHLSCKELTKRLVTVSSFDQSRVSVPATGHLKLHLTLIMNSREEEWSFQIKEAADPFLEQVTLHKCITKPSEEKKNIHLYQKLAGSPNNSEAWTALVGGSSGQPVTTDKGKYCKS